MTKVGANMYLTNLERLPKTAQGIAGQMKEEFYDIHTTRIEQDCQG